MIDFSKVVKGDKITNKKTDKTYLVVDTRSYPQCFTVKEITDENKHETKRIKFYLSNEDVADYEKVLEWSKPRQTTSVNGRTAKYITNRKDIIFTFEGKTIVTRCHPDDVFNLKNGLDKCWEKADSPVNASTAVFMNSRNLEGHKFGDFVALKVVGKDKSRHNIWECVCPKHGDSIRATAYDLMHGRSDTVCSYCEKERKATLVAVKEPEPFNQKNFCDSLTLKIGESAKNNAASIVKTVDNNVPFDSLGSVYFKEEKKDLLSFPVYYSIAHCIPADLSVYGKTANKINEYYDFLNYFITEDFYDLEAGDVTYYKNLFTLFPNEAKFTKVKESNLISCLSNLADYCYQDGIKYLAMPRICCGGNKMLINKDNKRYADWEYIKKLIISIFDRKYNFENNHVCSANKKEIYITFCNN